MAAPDITNDSPSSPPPTEIPTPLPPPAPQVIVPPSQLPNRGVPKPNFNAVAPSSRPKPPGRIASASTPAPVEDAKPSSDDRIAPVGTAYEPVKLATPGKLANRWNPGGAQDSSPEPPSTGGSIKDRMAAFSGGGGATKAAASPSSGKKLTWSERQAETKRQQAEEDRSSSAASAAGKTGLHWIGC